MSLCPCGSELEYTACCEPYLNREKEAPTPEALLRSRYTAFTKADVKYIMKTIHPEKKSEFNENEIKDWSQNSEWIDLKITATDKGEAADDIGYVSFLARYKQRGKVQNHGEISTFKKVDDIWYFFDGESAKQETFIRDEERVGRNDPCSCGSGKKFKKCCGK
ncbi:MAG: YchJ family metal-binding protein [Fibrobacterales bacterium]